MMDDIVPGLRTWFYCGRSLKDISVRVMLAKGTEDVEPMILAGQVCLAGWCFTRLNPTRQASLDCDQMELRRSPANRITIFDSSEVHGGPLSDLMKSRCQSSGDHELDSLTKIGVACEPSPRVSMSTLLGGLMFGLTQTESHDLSNLMASHDVSPGISGSLTNIQFTFGKFSFDGLDKARWIGRPKDFTKGSKELSGIVW